MAAGRRVPPPRLQCVRLRTAPPFNSINVLRGHVVSCRVFGVYVCVCVRACVRAYVCVVRAGVQQQQRRVQQPICSRAVDGPVWGLVVAAASVALAEWSTRVGVRVLEYCSGGARKAAQTVSSAQPNAHRTARAAATAAPATTTKTSGHIGRQQA